MDEATLRQHVSNAARQLWMRGLLVADGGLLSAEVHRRRYLVTPPGKRRSDMQDEDLRLCDIGGVELNGSLGLDEELWKIHRLAYLVGLDRQAGAPSTNSHPRRDAIGATLLVTPPMIQALLRLTPGAKELLLAGFPPVPVLNHVNEQTLREALKDSNLIALGPDRGLFCAAGDIWTAVNLVELLEHMAYVEIAIRGRSS